MWSSSLDFIYIQFGQVNRICPVRHQFHIFADSLQNVRHIDLELFQASCKLSVTRWGQRDTCRNCTRDLELFFLKKYCQKGGFRSQAHKPSVGFIVLSSQGRFPFHQIRLHLLRRLTIHLPIKVSIFVLSHLKNSLHLWHNLILIIF